MAQPKTTPATPSDRIGTPGYTTPNSDGGASANPVASGAGAAQRPGTSAGDMSFGVGYGGTSAGPAFDLVRQSTGSTKGAR